MAANEKECKTCGKRFNKKWRLVEHEMTHTGERPYVCDYEGCEQAFIRASHLKRHKIRHTGVKEFVCTIEGCSQAFTIKHNLDRHEKRAHNKPFKCKFEGCHKSFSKNSQLWKHECSHQDKMPYMCDVEGCDKGYKTNAHLKRHKKSHDLGYICSAPDCSERFSKFHELKTHLLTHGFKCNTCDKVFKYRYLLRNHSVVHKEERELFKCDKCDKTYTKAFNLKNHIDVHHNNIKAYPCTYENCNKVFAHLKSQKQHLKTHEESGVTNARPKPVKTHPCPIANCSELFANKRSITRHIRRWHPDVAEPKKKRKKKKKHKKSKRRRDDCTNTTQQNTSSDQKEKHSTYTETDEMSTEHTTSTTNKQKDLNTIDRARINEHHNIGSVAIEQSQDETIDNENSLVCGDEHLTNVGDGSTNWVNNTGSNSSVNDVFGQSKSNSSKTTGIISVNDKRQNRANSISNIRKNAIQSGTIECDSSFSNVILDNMSSDGGANDYRHIQGGMVTATGEQYTDKCHEHHHHHDLAYQISVISQCAINNNSTSDYCNSVHININQKDNHGTDTSCNDGGTCNGVDENDNNDIATPSDYNSALYESHDGNVENEKGNKTSSDNNINIASNHGDNSNSCDSNNDLHDSNDDDQDSDEDNVGVDKAKMQSEENCTQIITNDRGVMIMLFEDDD